MKKVEYACARDLIIQYVAGHSFSAGQLMIEQLFPRLLSLEYFVICSLMCVYVLHSLLYFFLTGESASASVTSFKFMSAIRTIRLPYQTMCKFVRFHALSIFSCVKKSSVKEIFGYNYYHHFHFAIFLIVLL